MTSESPTDILDESGSLEDEVVDIQWERVRFLIGILNFLRIGGD